MDRRQTGVRPRGNSIVIDFSYQGERCRESLRINPTKSALKEAHRKREAILYEIAMGTFEYSKHFPNSKKAYRYSKNKGALITIECALKEWVKRAQKRCELSTIKDYSSIIGCHLIPAFGDITLDQLRIENIYSWMDEVDISNKRVNNILSPLRQVFREAYQDGIIERNPLDRFRNLPNHQREPTPFTNEEIKTILDQLEGQHRNLVQFAFWTGLRTSELIALSWEDIDLDNKQIFVRKAVVAGREKTTKTLSGKRTIQLQPSAIDALRRQRRHTGEGHRVFIDPQTGKPWPSDQPIRKKVWIPALKAAGVKYRNPYQTRHTFASMMLSQGKNPLWVAQQMGHKDWGMIRKVYGRWIPQ